MPISATNYDGTQEYSVAEMGDLYKPNLLDNADFRSGIINRGGQTSYAYNSKAMLTIDRWITYGVNVALDDSSVRVVNRQTSARTLRQPITGESGTYTIYVNVKSVTGNVYVNLNSDTSKNKKLQQGENIFQITVLSSETLTSLALHLEANADIYLYGIKLEKGSNFTGMPFWKYTDEMSKCEKYFYSMRVEYQEFGVTANQEIRRTIPIPGMANTPSLSISNPSTVSAGQAKVSLAPGGNGVVLSYIPTATYYYIAAWITVDANKY